MPSIIKRTTPNGTISYQVKIRVKGYPPVTDTFSKKTDALLWAQRTEADIRENKYFPNNKAKKYIVSDLIDSYLKNVKLKNQRRHDEVKPLLNWWKDELGHIVLLYFKGESIVAAQQKLLSRKKQRKDADGNVRNLSPATVNRYMVALHTAINYGTKAKQEASSQMKDPSSVEFRNVEGYKRGDTGLVAICGEINAKNSYGGYVGYKQFTSVAGIVLLNDLEGKGAPWENHFNINWNNTCK